MARFATWRSTRSSPQNGLRSRNVSSIGSRPLAAIRPAPIPPVPSGSRGQDSAQTDNSHGKRVLRGRLTVQKAHVTPSLRGSSPRVLLRRQNSHETDCPHAVEGSHGDEVDVSETMSQRTRPSGSLRTFGAALELVTKPKDQRTVGSAR